ncbi:VPA1262 family N-terminal domain-containing protein [Psychrobacter namhaensis]|uniref:VPA1262 family N-terminal domain-containing protein n=1 Tax=Psychrobacter namhaensis TaxID=292734 RepID=UPI003CFE1337
MVELFSLYEKAEVRLVTAMVKINDSEPAESRLIFATVRLLPKDFHQSYSSELKKGPKSTFYRKVILSASDAIEWYRTANGNNLIVLEADEQFGEVDKEPTFPNIQIADFTDETAWGDFSIPLLDKNMLDVFIGNPTPFLGYNSARIHRRFGKQDNLLKIIDHPQVVDFVKRGLFIDLKEYPEYIGGMVLILPNPIVKSIEDRLLQAQEKEGIQELRLLKLNPYPSQSLEKLKLINFETHLGLLKKFEQIDIPDDGIIALPNKNPYQSHGYFLIHELYGCLEFRPATSYIRQVNSNLQIVGSTLNVRTRENSKKTSPTHEYSSSIIDSQQETVIGSIEPDEVFHRVIRAQTNRNSDKMKLQASQFWFEEGDRQQALNKIGGLINEANSKIEFYDPYFSDLQITQFATQARVKGLHIAILTSKIAFNSVQDAKDIQAEIENIHNENVGFNITCLVLDQETPTLHDRFLVIDETIWFVGHSFNRIGEQNSFMTKVPYPITVFNKLKDIKSQAIHLEEYISKYATA